MKEIVIISILVLIFSCNKKKSLTVESLHNNFTENEIYTELLQRDSSKSKFLIKDSINSNLNVELKEYSSDTLRQYIKTIYGDWENDDRHNFYENILSTEMKLNANKVASLIFRNQLFKRNDGNYEINIKEILGERYKLCQNENFFNEPVAPFCTGFAMSSKLFVTAGHCTNNIDITKILIIYGFKMVSKSQANIIINPSDIFEPNKIVSPSLNDIEKDYAVIEIKNTFPQEKVAQIRTNGKIPDNDSIYVIGYPCGLPVKIALDAKVEKNDNPNYFIINSDTYCGNSGSPVFNLKTNMVEGILVRGGRDTMYLKVNNCYTNFHCPQDLGGLDCPGEGVTRTSLFANFLKK